MRATETVSGACLPHQELREELFGRMAGVAYATFAKLEGERGSLRISTFLGGQQSLQSVVESTLDAAS